LAPSNLNSAPQFELSPPICSALSLEHKVSLLPLHKDFKEHNFSNSRMPSVEMIAIVEVPNVIGPFGLALWLLACSPP
jgi:hypothetical protein